VVTHHHDLEPGPWYVRWTDRWLAGATDRAIAVSDAVAEVWIRRHLPRERIVVVPNAVHDRWRVPVDPAQRQALRSALGIPPDAPVVGTVTRFDAVKDLPALLEAVHRLRTPSPAHLLLVGDGPERPALEERLRALGLTGRAHCVGFQDDPRPYVALMDVMVVCSLHEGFSTALLEAMALGRPVVATSGSGMSELVQDGRNGLLVPPHAPARLAEAVQRLLDDPGLAAALSSQAGKDAGRFTVAAHVAGIERIYRDVRGR